MQACLVLDARPRMPQQDRASERGTGRLTLWAVSELWIVPYHLPRSSTVVLSRKAGSGG